MLAPGGGRIAWRFVPTKAKSRRGQILKTPAGRPELQKSGGCEDSRPPVRHFVASEICATGCEGPQVFDPTWATRIVWAEFVRAPSLKRSSYRSSNLIWISVHAATGLPSGPIDGLNRQVRTVLIACSSSPIPRLFSTLMCVRLARPVGRTSTSK
jgi:hypothetical protein